MRRWVTLALTAALAVSVSGCWPARGGGPNRTGYNAVERAFTADTIDDLELTWTFSSSWDSSWHPVPTSPVVSAGGVHVGSWSESGYRLYTLAPRDGSVRWSQLMDSRGLRCCDPQGPPAVIGDRVLVSTVRDNSTIVDTVHGSTQIFDIETGEDLGVVADGGDIQAVNDGGFGALVVPDSSTSPYHGTSWTAWIGALGHPDATVQPINLTVEEFTLRDGLGGVTLGGAYFFHTGVGVSSSAPGTTTQSRGLRAYTSGPRNELECGPLGQEQKRVECPSWVLPLPYSVPRSAPVVAPNSSTVYVAGNYQGLLAVDMATGAVRWTGQATTSSPTVTPALAGGRIYAGTQFGLAAFDASGCGAATCPPLWEAGPTAPDYTSYGQALQQPVVAGDVVFVATLEGQQPRLVAYDADGCGQALCAPIRAIDLPAQATGELAISGGRLYVPTEAGLLAYGVA